jgi:hypothetical protein
MPRRLFALLLCAAATVVPVGGQPPPTPPVAGDKPVVPPEPEYECRFDDGSVVRLSVGLSAVSVKTRFGPMTVPLADARKIEMGFRYPEGVEAKVRQAIDDLGSADFRTRQAGQKALVGFGEYSIPLVKAGTQNGTPEVAERCAAVLKTISATLPDDKSDPPMEDVITTDDMVVRGKITSDSFKATSKYFGETTVKLVYLREMRPVGGRFIGTFPLDATKYAAVGWKTYFDTGLDVEKGQPLEVSATGKIDLNPASPKQFVFGPNGGGTQVAGPGQRLQEEQIIRGGRGPGFAPGGEGYGPLYTSGALYGRIGASGKLFKVGEKLTVPKAGEAGRLYLVIAPSSYGTSKGEFDVKVRLGK